MDKPLETSKTLMLEVARLIKEFESVEEKFSTEIGSKYGILPGSRDNSLYNALWVAQALLRKGPAKTTDKRIILLTNEDDPLLVTSREQLKWI